MKIAAIALLMITVISSINILIYDVTFESRGLATIYCRVLLADENGDKYLVSYRCVTSSGQLINMEYILRKMGYTQKDFIHMLEVGSGSVRINNVVISWNLTDNEILFKVSNEGVIALGIVALIVTLLAIRTLIKRDYFVLR